MHNYIKSLPVLVLVLLLAGCEKKMPHEPLFKDGAAPSPVKNAVVENLSGSVRISYTLPGDPDLLYVKGVVTMSNGKVRDARSSMYTNSILIEGFNESKDYEVKLYAIDNSENASVPLSVTVHPAIAPVELVYASLVLQPDFGGANVSYTNVTGADISVSILMRMDSTAEWKTAETIYTTNKAGNFSARGYDSVPTFFAAFVKDRWDNRSDTLKLKFKPLFEQQLDKSKFKVYTLPTDQKGGHAVATWTVDKLWDNVITDAGGQMHSPPSSGMPQWFTFDLGVTYNLSRFKVYNRLGNTSGTAGNLYAGGTPKYYEIWGSNNPSANGDWTTWVKLLDCASFKPSGLALGVTNADDLAYATRGEDFAFPVGIPAMRYIRFKTLQTWGNAPYMNMLELTFWGKPQ